MPSMPGWLNSHCQPPLMQADERSLAPLESEVIHDYLDYWNMRALVKVLVPLKHLQCFLLSETIFIAKAATAQIVLLLQTTCRPTPSSP
jgi:hypothetical protein